jgi:hypothetical protein
MNYKIMMICALLAGSMHNAWAMEEKNTKEWEVHEKDKQMVRYEWLKQLCKELNKDLKPINSTMTAEQMRSNLDEQMASEYAAKSALKTLENLHLEDEGFCGRLPQPTQSYDDFWAGRIQSSNHAGD